MKSAVDFPKRFLFGLCVGFAAVTLSSCAGVNSIQPQVNGLAVAGRFDQALQILDNPKKYGTNNQLLLLMDKGLVLHMAGRYEESIPVFEEAKIKYEELYTLSLRKEAASWLWNDYALPYRGEDFERVMINVFQALNYAALGNLQEALVEARDADSTLNMINDQYPANKKNIYRRDAFCRLLTALLYEADGNVNDALIAYRLSWDAYQHDYLGQYGTEAPEILKENLLAAAEKFGDPNIHEYRHALTGLTYIPWDDKKKRAEIIVVEYQGYSPIKIPVQIPFPLPDGYISQISFPQYEKRSYETLPLQIKATALGSGLTYFNSSEIGEDIEAIAIKNLDDRKVRVIAKAALRPAAKYFAQKALENDIRKNHGEGTAKVIPILGSLYNLFSEQADLRSWQTLPAQIRIGHVFVTPGEYDLEIGRVNLGSVTVKAGEKKFYIVRTTN